MSQPYDSWKESDTTASGLLPPGIATRQLNLSAAQFTPIKSLSGFNCFKEERQYYVRNHWIHRF